MGRDAPYLLPHVFEQVLLLGVGALHEDELLLQALDLPRLLRDLLVQLRTALQACLV